MLRTIKEYSGFSFKEILDLPYSYFLLLRKESWIYSFQTSQEGTEILKNLWRLQQKDPDIKSIREIRGKENNNGRRD